MCVFPFVARRRKLGFRRHGCAVGKNLRDGQATAIQTAQGSTVAAEEEQVLILRGSFADEEADRRLRSRRRSGGGGGGRQR